MILEKVYDELYGMIEDLKKKIKAADVDITPSLESGIKIADYKVDGETGSLYAPTIPAIPVVEETVIFEDASGAGSTSGTAVTVTLEHDLNEFDYVYLLVAAYASGGSPSRANYTHTALTRVYDNSGVSSMFTYAGPNRNVGLTSTNESLTASVTPITESANINLSVYKIVGVNIHMPATQNTRTTKKKK